MTYLMVALLQSLLRKTLPAFRPVNSLRSIQRHVQITALDSQIEARVLFLHNVVCNLEKRGGGRSVCRN